MPYTTRELISTKLPDQFLVEALDDDGDGEEEAGLLDDIISVADTEIDGYLQGRYRLPLSPVPALLATCSLVLVLETLYFRRGFDAEKNPWRNRASELRARLRRIAAGEEALVVGSEKATPSAIVVAEPARTHSRAGRLMA